MLDPTSAQPTYGLALVHAHLRELDQARSYALTALSRDRLHRPSLLLSALLVTASKDLEKALALCGSALLHFPNDLQLLLLRAKLELAGGNTSGALATYQRCIVALRELRPPEMADPARSDGEAAAVVARPTVAPAAPRTVDGSVIALNLGPRPVSPCPRPPQATLTRVTRMALDDPSGLYQLELELWRAIGAAFLAAGQSDEAQGCVQELRALSPAGPAAHHLEGLIADHLHQPSAECYEKAVTLEPACRLISLSSSLARLTSVWQTCRRCCGWDCGTLLAAAPSARSTASSELRRNLVYAELFAGTR
jgi:tetratricopeptide (TPR) repeat protein